MEVHHDRPTNLPGRLDIEVAKAFYPVEIMRLWTKELTDKILGYVRSHLAVSFTPSGCKTFCKSLKLQELLNDKNYQMEPLPKETLCTLILAALGSQEEGSRKARQVFVIQDALGPLITDGYVGVCCRTLQKLCARVKDCMLRSSNGGRM